MRSDQQQLAELRKQLQRWGDRGYIQHQARLRLQYAMPGDTVYVVTGPGQESDITKADAQKNAMHSATTWNQRLRETVQKAGS